MEAARHKTATHAPAPRPAPAVQPIAAVIAARDVRQPVPRVQLRSALRVSSPRDPAEREAEATAKQIDDAFIRRFHSIVPFAMPRPPERERLWREAFSKKSRLEERVDLARLAEKHEMAGGTIMKRGAVCLAPGAEPRRRHDPVAGPRGGDPPGAAQGGAGRVRGRAPTLVASRGRRG